MRRFITTMAVALCLFWITPLKTAMTGGEFELYADSFSFTSVDEATGQGFSIFSSGGGVASTSTSGGVVDLRGGFQAAEKGILSLSLDTNSVALGELSAGKVSSGRITLTASTDSETGYTISISEDGNLRTTSGASDINDVSDGEVTAGQEEYGIRISGRDALLSGDRAISGAVDIASFSGMITSRSTGVEFRASRGSNTPEGSYSHRVMFTLTANP